MNKIQPPVGFYELSLRQLTPEGVFLYIPADRKTPPKKKSLVVFVLYPLKNVEAGTRFFILSPLTKPM